MAGRLTWAHGREREGVKNVNDGPEGRDGPTLGFLYPGHAAEDDYPRAARMLRRPVDIALVHTSVGVDAHERKALLDLGGLTRLLEGADQLRSREPDVAVWACTSGSFVFGWDGATQQVAAISEHLACPASSTSFAFVNAVRAVGAERVAVAATYPDDVAGAFAEFLGHAGIEVLSVGSEDVITAAEVGTFGHDRVLSFVRAGDRPEADAVLVPDTALHSIEWIAELEEAVGKPVLTANQVTLWEALRLAEALGPETGLGRLFATG